MFQIPYGKNLLSFNLSNKRINYFIILAYCLYLFILCQVIFPHDVLIGIFAMPVVFSPTFCLNHPFGFSIQQGYFASNFAQVALSGFQPTRLFFFFLLNVVSSKSIHVDQVKHLLPIKICNSCSTPLDMIVLIIKGPNYLGFIFPLGSNVSSLSTFRIKFASLGFLGFTFLLNALEILFQQPFAWYCALDLFSFIKANCSYLSFIQMGSIAQ